MTLQKMTKPKLRIKYAIMFLLLLGIEVLIAFFAHDQLIRAYVGDVLIVMLLYCAVRTILPDKGALLPLYLFIFATGVEFLQYFELAQIIGADSNIFIKILLGSTFDWLDIGCYAVGCILLWIYEKRNNK